MSPEVMTIVLFGSLFLAFILGVPVVFAMGGVGVIGTYIFWGPAGIFRVATTAFSSGTEFVMVAIPLFVLMGALLEKSGIAPALYEAMYQWMGGIKGGLAMGTVAICTVMAAMVGISAAAMIPVGLVALPSMLKRGYDKKIVTGCVMAGGALGILIPPSTFMIVLGAYTNISVGKLFMGGVGAGLLLSALYIVYIGVRSWLQPNLGPPVPAHERVGLRQKLGMLRSVILPIILVLLVMGSILTGAATPTEAAGVGAFGAFLCALIYGRFTWRGFLEACYGGLKLSCMVLWIMFAAGVFTGLYLATNAPQVVTSILTAMPGGRWGMMIAMQFIIFVLGFGISGVAIMMITMPLFMPMVISAGFDPVWFGVLYIINMETAYLTPPVGTNLFYMKAIAPEGITMGDIINSVWPFVGLQLLGMALCMIFPQIILWLPSMMIK